LSLFNELKRRNVIRVAIGYVAGSWLLIQVAETLFPLFGLPDSATRMVVIILGIGLIPALMLSWVFEFTPEGLKLESNIDRSQPIDKDKGKTFDRAVMVVLALALTYFAFDKFILAESRMETARQEGRSQALTESYGDKSIAVLSFVDMSPDKNQEYMSDGIAEELLNLLAKIPELRVISRSSAFSFKGKDIDIPTIAEQLNVAHILEGSIRKAGDRIRITTQLIEARSDTHLWSETYDRVLDDIFGIQDEIAQKVVDELKFTLLGESPRATQTDPEAYEEYLLGQHLMHDRTKASLKKAVEHFVRAIEADPNYAPAYAAQSLAWSLLLSGYARYGDLTLEESVGNALPLANKALELDPDLAEAYVAMGLIRHGQQNYVDAMRQYDKAIELNPNYALAYNARGVAAMTFGDYDAELESVRKAAELDPLALAPQGNYVHALFRRGRYDELEPGMQRIKAIGLHFWAYSRYWHQWHQGQFSDAIVTLMEGRESEPAFRPLETGLIYMFSALDLRAESERLLNQADRKIPWQWQGNWETVIGFALEDYQANPDDRLTVAALGEAYLAGGDLESAAPLLERYIESFEDGVGPSAQIAGYVTLLRQAKGDANDISLILETLKAREERAIDGGLVNIELDLMTAMIALIEDNEEKALDALQKIAAGPGIARPLVASLRLLTPLKDSKRFDDILTAQAAHIASERVKTLERICGGANWKNWQPLPETCEQR